MFQSVLYVIFTGTTLVLAATFLYLFWRYTKVIERQVRALSGVRKDVAGLLELAETWRAAVVKAEEDFAERVRAYNETIANEVPLDVLMVHGVTSKDQLPKEVRDYYTRKEE